MRRSERHAVLGDRTAASRARLPTAGDRHPSDLVALANSFAQSAACKSVRPHTSCLPHGWRSTRYPASAPSSPASGPGSRRAGLVRPCPIEFLCSGTGRPTGSDARPLVSSPSRFLTAGVSRIASAGSSWSQHGRLRYPAHPLVEKLTSGSDGPASKLLGYFGSTVDGVVRVYLSLDDLSVYYEISEDDIVHVEDASTDELPNGGSAIWVKASARVERCVSERTSVEACYLAGGCWHAWPKAQRAPLRRSLGRPQDPEGSSRFGHAPSSMVPALRAMTCRVSTQSSIGVDSSPPSTRALVAPDIHAWPNAVRPPVVLQQSCAP